MSSFYWLLRLREFHRRFSAGDSCGRHFVPLILPLTVCVSILLPSQPSHGFCFTEAGQKFNISAQLLAGIARTESNMNPRALNRNRNGSVDYGVMQINSSWVKSLGLPLERLLGDPCYNVSTGARILRDCLDRHGSTWNAVGCYNASSPQKRISYAWKVFRNLEKSGQEYLSQVAVAKKQEVLGKTEKRSYQELTVAVTDLYWDQDEQVMRAADTGQLRTTD